MLLSCKAFDLDDAIKSFAPAVGPKDLDHPAAQRHACISTCWTQKFGASRVLGGLCAIAVTLNEQREVVQLAPCSRSISASATAHVGSGPRDRGGVRERQFGARGQRDRHAGHVGEVGVPGVDRGLDLSDAHPVGNILAAPGGKDFLLGMLDECSGGRDGRGLSRPAGRSGTRDRDVDHGGLAARPHRCSATSRRANRSKPTM